MVHAEYSHYFGAAVRLYCLSEFYFPGDPLFLGYSPALPFTAEMDPFWWARKLNPCPYGAFNLTVRGSWVISKVFGVNSVICRYYKQVINYYYNKLQT